MLKDIYSFERFQKLHYASAYHFLPKANNFGICHVDNTKRLAFLDNLGKFIAAILLIQ